MGIRKPTLSSVEAGRLAVARSKDFGRDAPLPATVAVTRDADENNLRNRFQETQAVAKLAVQADKQPVAKVDALDLSNEEKTQVFLSAQPPTMGVSPTFDKLTLHYPPKKSLQMILRRALDDYEALLEDGSFITAPESYPVVELGSAASKFVHTSHMFPASLVDVARAHFDPLGLETGRAFGRKLATAALAFYFISESLP